MSGQTNVTGPKGNRNIAAYRMLLGATLLLIPNAPALADTTTLVCRMDSPSAYADEPAKVELNEAQSSIALYFPLEHLTNPGGVQGGADGQGGTPANTVGPLHAAFTSEKITFTNTTPWGPIDGSIDRVTGILNYGNPFGAHWQCQAAKPQF